MAKIRDLKGGKTPDRFSPPYEVRNEYNEYEALLMNAIKIDPLNYNEEQRIKKLLIQSNQVGYDVILKLWASITASAEKNNYDMPLSGTLYLPATGKIITRKLSYEAGGDTYLIKGLPGEITYGEIIRQHTDVMYQCDVAIRQNLLATKTPCFFVVKDKNTRLSVEQAIQQQQAGMPAIIIGGAVYEALQGIPTNTPIVFNQIYEFRQKVRDALLNKLSTLTSNVDKKERVQTAEIGATVGQCEDYIYMLIDNFNKQMESYGLIPRMRINSSLEELYTATTDPAEEL